MSAPRSLRVHFVTHWDGRVTGTLLRRATWIFDRPAPAAYGTSHDDVLGQLDVLLQAAIATKEDELERYLWEDSFAEQVVAFDVHPQTTVKKRPVIGARSVPLRVTYMWSKLEGGGFRVLIPRFGWWLTVEDLSIARDTVRQLVGTALLGETPRSIYDFRTEGDETVRAWAPRLVASRALTAPEEVEMPTVRAVADDLTERAAQGKLPFVVSDGSELDAAMPMVLRATPASLLLVGGPGVGKSTWVRSLARRLVTHARAAAKDEGRRAPRIWSTNGGRILSGMAYLGMWQERCLRMVDELTHAADYLHVDRLAGILAPQSDGASIADVLLPAIRMDEISVIAECSEDELERFKLRAASLVACFQIVRVREPAGSEMLAFIESFEARKNALARMHPAGRKRLVRHLETFRRDARFPGKAVRFLEWMHQEGERGGRARTLYPRDVSEAYARFSGLPLDLIADEIPAGAEAIARGLRAAVVGQDDACATAARVLARFKAGLNDPERPIGTLLFVGPTGVGKTELAKQLARTMFGDASRMIRLDMSEYMLPGASARLLDVSTGSASLAARVRQEPLSLVLFDEIEKAGPEVFDLLLGILGEGRLTDADGLFVDFRMTLLVMTSNLGVADTRPVGFGGASPGTLAAVRAHFRPELFNRIDHVVPFHALSPSEILAIVDLELAKANTRTGLVRRNLRIVVDAPARARLAELGFDPRRGARPLVRTIEERVMTPIAVRMAADPSLRDREIAIGLADVEGTPAR